MKDEIRITEEEMSALFPYAKVPDTHLEEIRSRIMTRCALVVLLLAVRAIVVIYYPEYHFVTILNERLVNPEVVLEMTQFRLTFAAFGSLLYIYSFYKNLYFRFVNLTVLIVLCSLIVGDFQAFFMLSSFADLTYPAIGMISLRFIIAILLLQNHLDIRRD